MPKWPDSHLKVSIEPFEEQGVQHLPGWYFYDEASYLHGPFESREVALKMMEKYIKEVLNGQEG